VQSLLCSQREKRLEKIEKQLRERIFRRMKEDVFINFEIESMCKNNKK